MRTYKFLTTTPNTNQQVFTSITFRPVTLADLPGLEWEGQYRHFRRLYQDTYNRVVSGSALMWIAVIPGGKIIGQMFIQLRSTNMDLADGINRAYMFGFRMREDYRSAGIGSSLLEYAEEDLVQRQFKYMCLNVAQTNTRALELYKRLGYVVLGPDPGKWSYQDDNGEWRQVEEPAWRMEKLLVPVNRDE